MKREEEKFDVTEVEESKEVETVLEEENRFLFKLSKPYRFEGKDYTEVDLSGMERLTIQDMSRIEKRRGLANGYQSFSMTPEHSVDYACYFAAEASGLPVEFFFGLPASDGIELRKKVSSFLLW